MTEYRGSAILICSPLPALRTKNSFEIIRSTTHSVDESYKLGVYEFTQHLVIEDYCNGMNLSSQGPVRVKGGMSLRNGMWHGLRNDIIMRNLIYAAE